MSDEALTSELRKQFTDVTITDIDGERFYHVVTERCAIGDSQSAITVELNVVDEDADFAKCQPRMLIALTIGDEIVFLTQNAAGRVADAIAKTKAVVSRINRKT